MIEAVGEKYLDQYFNKIKTLLDLMGMQLFKGLQ